MIPFSGICSRDETTSDVTLVQVSIQVHASHEVIVKYADSKTRKLPRLHTSQLRFYMSRLGSRTERVTVAVHGI